MSNFRNPFPLVRWASAPMTRLLLLTPLSANAVTALALASGAGALFLLADADAHMRDIGALLFLVSYVLDNCDGEIARARGQCSDFGRRFDTFVDWFVNSAVFVAIGIGAAERFESMLWFWLGVVAASGGTVNYLLSLRSDADDEDSDTEAEASPQGPREWAVYILRELFRADFCFIVLALTLVDMLWLLLPAAAIGAHAYWLAGLVKGARRFHV